MSDRLKELPQEIIDTFFRDNSEEAAGERIPKKALIVIASILALSLVLSIFVIILYVIPYKQKMASFKNRPAASENSIYAGYLVKDGLINRETVEEVRFEGDAAKESAFLKNSIELAGGGSADSASLVMKFAETLDMAGKNILITARAKRGIKKMSIILKDSRNRVYEHPAVEFSPDWSLKQAYMGRAETVDLKNIEEIRLEFDSTIYLKDITVRGDA